MPTCYSPVRRFPPGRVTPSEVHARLACVKHAASVRPEPGSNSPLEISIRPVHVRPDFVAWLYESASLESGVHAANRAQPASHDGSALAFGTLFSSQGTRPRSFRPQSSSSQHEGRRRCADDPDEPLLLRAGYVRQSPSAVSLLGSWLPSGTSPPERFWGNTLCYAWPGQAVNRNEVRK